MKLFSGSAHPKLTQEVAQLLSVPLAKAEIVRFADSEGKVTIQENVQNEDCVIIQPTCNPTDENLMELFFFADALKRSEAKKIIGILPLFGYARQDKQHRPGECVSLHVVIKFLETIGFDKIYTFELHEDASADSFSIPFENLSACTVLADAIHNHLSANDLQSIVLAAPDDEAVERTRTFGEQLLPNKDFSVVVIEKKRNLDTIHQSKSISLHGDVQSKTVILVDDVITSGGTVIHASELCLEKGATKVLAAITHHDFSAEAPPLLQNSPIGKFFITNTIPLKENEKFPKLQEVSIAPLIARALKSSV